MVMHLGERLDGWSPRTIEYSITALEHLGAFARPLGVRLLVENLMSEPTTPAHLLEILNSGHMDQVGVCLDLGHAHLTVGTTEAIATLGNRIASVHVHDNHSEKDEHLWPGDGDIAWPATVEALKALDPPPATVLEISQSLGADLAAIPSRAQQAFELLN
jgi:sugar phosphate isomerase/epimerase